MLSVALLCVLGAFAFQHVSALSDGGNFLDDKWLTGKWDKFRDEVEEPGTWTPPKPFDQGLDPAKDPCLKIKCSRHKVCVAEDYKTATCVSQRRVSSFKDASLYQSPGSKCTPCPVVHPSPVCGSDGHTYSTKCKLEYQACMTGKKIALKCSGMCPCTAQSERIPPAKKVCSESDLKEVVSRLRDWFRVLHENSNHKRVKIQKPEKNKFEVGASSICKDPLGWMFSRLDTNFDMQLDQSEIKSLYLDRNEPCSDAFFKSCDTYPDKVITSSEWCTGFQRYTDSPCKAELSSINKKQAGKKLLGQYLPSCDEDGYYRSHQCHSSSGQCWCVDRYGNEVASSRTHGPADCGVILESSGDLGSGDSIFTDDDDDDDDDDESFVLNDRAGMDDEDDEDEDDDEDDEYLS
ncbi:testican-3 isoform X1 [Gouania willdenowi]|uniref:testican-3 isoform X1 n=1 Tax=Gouania willdenowi TaxID=441366 RepID=UPI001054900A|nr:testican-3-like isoform X1 [Gouania willdenowi]